MRTANRPKTLYCRAATRESFPPTARIVYNFLHADTNLLHSKREFPSKRKHFFWPREARVWSIETPPPSPLMVSTIEDTRTSYKELWVSIKDAVLVSNVHLVVIRIKLSTRASLCLWFPNMLPIQMKYRNLMEFSWNTVRGRWCTRFSPLFLYHNGM